MGATVGSVLMPVSASAQTPLPDFTRADSLRGSNGPARFWWDVTFYDLAVRISPSDSTISGSNAITYEVWEAGDDLEMQIDLQAPLVIDSIMMFDDGGMGERLVVRDEGNAHFARVPGHQFAGDVHSITVYYRGRPITAANPPWDGGFIWETNADGAPWVATANQGLGASVWWPNKDYQGEEPDSQRIALTVPDPMMDVSNGRLRSVVSNRDGTSTYEWFVASPINNYAIAVNAGRFAHWQETYNGLDGPLTLDFYPLAENEAEARRQWVQTRPMMRCFEEWFGPYPWYEDGFKMVESPHLGMEHQSAIAYGNGYQNGYLGRDLSGTGRGLAWDFIIIHETAHEWWGNNITTKDVADMWVHESFANYSENLYTECLTGSRRAGAEYVIGTRAAIQNDRPIVGAYGVQNQGSGDMYYKGGNMLHLIRQLIDDDARWRSILRGLNTDFARQTVSGAQVEEYIATRSGLQLDKVFDQYLRATGVPVLEWSIAQGVLAYRWMDVVEGFDMPVRVRLNAGPESEAGRAPRQIEGSATGTVEPSVEVDLPATEAWQELVIPTDATSLTVDIDFYVEDRRVAR
jgi:aminopeptidase N